MSYSFEDITKVTLDYFYADEDRVVDSLFMSNLLDSDSNDQWLFEDFMREAEKRGYSRDHLVQLALQRKSRLVDLLRNPTIKIGGGSEIRSPFSYPSGMRSS